MGDGSEPWGPGKGPVKPMARRHDVVIKRVYDAKARTPDEGTRILVDRLWPRGVAKADLEFDHWPKDLTPSPELRKWYGHEVDRWDRFVERYRSELSTGAPAAALEEVREQLRTGPVTLLTAVKDVDHSAAAVLAMVLTER